MVPEARRYAQETSTDIISVVLESICDLLYTLLCV